MGFTGTLLGGALGWAFGGPIGALVGSVIGGNIGAQESSRRQAPPDGASAAVGLVVLMAAVTRVDEKTTRGEVLYVKEFLVRNFGRDNASDLMQIYRQALDRDLDLDAICSQIRRSLDRPSLVELLHVLFGLVNSDGPSPAESEIVREAGRKLGLSDEEIGRVEAIFHEDTDRAYNLLGASRDEPIDAIKGKYRGLVMKYHPDRVAHLGEEFRELAKEKFQVIQEAWETIEAERSR